MIISQNSASEQIVYSKPMYLLKKNNTISESLRMACVYTILIALKRADTDLSLFE